MKIPLAQYARLLLTALSVSVLAACGGGSGESESAVPPAPPPTAEFSAALVNGNCTALQLTSLAQAGTGTSLTDYKWDATLTGNAAQTKQGADATTASFTLAACGSVAVTHTVTDSQGRSATVERTLDTSALAPSITDVTPKVATVNVPVTLTVTGTNIPATVALNMADASCGAPQSVTSTGFTVVCTAQTAGSKGLIIKTEATAGGGRVIDGTWTITVYNGATLNASTYTPSAGEQIHFWITNAVSLVRSVVWSFSDSSQTQTAMVYNGASTGIIYAFASTGSQTVTATYKDASGATVGSDVLNLMVASAAAPFPTAAITDIVDDSVSPGVSVPANGSTTDTSPMVKGTVSQVLGACGSVNPCYRVQVFEGNTALGDATVNGTAWTFSSTFAVGTHKLTAAVVRFDGERGAISTARSFSITVAATGKLPHSGITASQCYAAGGSTLLACSQPGALALNGQQDGHRAGINPMSYSRVGSYAVTSCVKDNVTGLIWEGKEASGPRAGNNKYYFGNAYADEVNEMHLCGFSDWRLPTVIELLTLVDYGGKQSIDEKWFPNSAEIYLSSEYGDQSMSAMAVAGGYVYSVVYYLRGRPPLVTYYPMRLVRTSQK